jgi:flagellar hook assembly protein FlgD
VSGSGTTASSVSAKSVSASSNWVDPDAQMTMKVYTTAGRLIWSKTFEGASIGSSGSHLLYWNEKDIRGANLASGAYIVVVTVKSHGQTTSATTKILILK